MIDTKEFDSLKTIEEKQAYAAQQVAEWRDVQRKLYRIVEAETQEEKIAITAKLSIADK
jgi:hypothetical protein